MASTELVELVKLSLQLAFALMEQANLTEEEEIEMLANERGRFIELRKTPLPDV
jgi:hypothetical protein